MRIIYNYYKYSIIRGKMQTKVLESLFEKKWNGIDKRLFGLYN